MCGFFSIFGAPLLTFTASQEAELSVALAHRGPDDFQVVEGPRYKAMFWRLSIVDQVGGKQPMVSPDGWTTVLFNGEVYNYKALRQTLKAEGAVFSGQSDTEVVLQAYRAWGLSAFNRFQGMFALCIIDHRTNRVVLCRDRLGVKPLYFRQEPGGLSVASEQKALVSSAGTAARLDLTAFRSYLVFQTIPGTRTLFQGISKVPPGGILCFDLSTCHLTGVERVGPATDKPMVPSYEEYREVVRETILEQVRLAYDTDLPMAFHLSGGLDCNTLVGLCRSFDPDREIRCVTSLVDGQRDAEWSFIREAAAHHEARLDVVDVTPEAFFGVLDDVIYQLDEPVGDPGVVAQFLVNRLAAAESKIVYSGQGFDEMFFGYIRDLAAAVLATHGPEGLDVSSPAYSKVPEETRKFFAGWEGFLGSMAWPRGMTPEFALFKKLCRFNPFETAEGLREEFSMGLRSVALDAYLELTQTGVSLHESILSMETGIQLPSLLHMEDRASMRYSLETRVPFCTAAVLDLAYKSRLEWSLHGGQPKGLLRDIFGHVLPPTILRRREKVGRPIPFRAWMKSDVGRDYLDEVYDNRELFRDLTGEDLLSFAMAHPNPHDRTAWALLCLSRWLDIFKVTV